MASDPVFLVCAHTDPTMFRLLAMALRPYRVVAHIDRKSPITPFVDANPGNVEFTRRRATVSWAAYSQVQAIRELWAHVATEPAETQLVLLTGQDYPTRPVQEFADHLARSVRKDFANSFEIDDSTGAKYTQQIRRSNYRDALPSAPMRVRRPIVGIAAKTVGRLSRPSPQPPFPTRHGQANWVVTKRRADQIEAMLTPDVERYFRSTFAPDEKVVHTLLAVVEKLEGSPSPSCVEYRGPGNWRYTNFHYVRPDLGVLGLHDLEDILASGCFFARKVTSAQSAGLIRELRSRVVTGEG